MSREYTADIARGPAAEQFADAVSMYRVYVRFACMDTTDNGICGRFFAHSAVYFAYDEGNISYISSKHVNSNI